MTRKKKVAVLLEEDVELCVTAKQTVLNTIYYCVECSQTTPKYNGVRIYYGTDLFPRVYCRGCFSKKYGESFFDGILRKNEKPKHRRFIIETEGTTA